MIITDICPYDKKRRKVYIDGQYAFPLYNSEIRKYHIETERELSEEEYEEIKKLLVKRVNDRIIYLITDCDKSERSIHDKMIRAGYSEEIVNISIAKLKGYGYIDDFRFARFYAESLAENHGKSRRAIENKLFEKGIPKDIICIVIEELNVDENKQIINELRKKGYTSQSLLDCDFDTRRKIYASLARKGFSADSLSHFFLT